VRTHPVTGLKALNVNQGFVTGFAELKKKESGKKYQPVVGGSQV
jgi:sulfonate dioxygenase